MGMYEFKNTKAPNLSNLIALQSQGASNAFSSLANIGNTIQGIQQKNIDRENRNLLAQGMLESLNKDPNLINTINQGVNKGNLPLNQLNSLINVRKNQIADEQAINDQRLNLTVADTRPNEQKNLLMNNLNERDTAIPASIFNPVVNNTNLIRTAISNNQDQSIIRNNTSSPDPKVNENNLNSVPFSELGSSSGITSLTEKQNKVSDEVKNQNIKLNATDLDYNTDKLLNINSPLYEKIQFTEGNETDALSQIENNISQRSDKLLTDITNNSTLTPIEKQQRLIDLKEKVTTFKKDQYTDAIGKGIIDPTKPENIKLLKTLYTSEEIPNLVSIYNTKNFDFNKNIKSNDPAFSPLVIAKSAINKYKIFEEENRSSFNSLLGEALKNKTAFEKSSDGEAILSFKDKWGRLMSKSEIIDTVENIKDELGKNRDLLTTPEILSIMDKMTESQYLLLPGKTRVRLSNWLTSDNTLKKNLSDITPAKKIAVASEFETKQVTDSFIQEQTKLLQNLKKQYLDVSNPISKEVVLNKIKEVSDTLNNTLLTYKSKKELTVNNIGNN